MDLKQLRNFVAIVDHGTFLAAAEAIHLSQPALSRSLQSLEASLDVKLLNRSTRGIQITEVGERFYRRAKLILSEAEKAVNETKGDNTNQNLNVGMAPLFAGQLLPHALREVCKKNSTLKLTVTSGLFPELINDLSSGRIDLMISNLPFTAIPADLVVEPLLDISIVYVASALHPLSRKRSCTFKDLAKFPWAVVDERHANDLYQYILTSEGETTSPIALKTNSLTLLKSMISEPPFITLLPLHMVEEDVSEKKLAILKTNQDRLKRKGGLVYRKNDVVNPILEHLKLTLRGLIS